VQQSELPTTRVPAAVMWTDIERFGLRRLHGP
jgi:hypothetical protein